MIKYLAILLLLLLAELIYFRVAKQFNIYDEPNVRSSHKHITLRGGGIIILLGVWVWFFLFGLKYPLFLIGVTTVAVISFIDDLRSLPERVSLIFQIIALLIMFYDLNILHWQNWWIVIASLILCVGIINAYNFMDGINGITAGYTLSVIIPMLFINRSLQYIDTSFLLVVGISVFVFAFFNFRKKAKCFAGDVGAVTIAFILIFAICKLIILTGDFTYLLFLAVYGVDTVLTICHRILLHEHLGEAHRKHCYQLMANELKIPHLAVSSFYMIIQLFISFGLILIPINHWFYLTLILVLLCSAYLLFIKKYYRMHQVYLDSLD